MGVVEISCHLYFVRNNRGIVEQCQEHKCQCGCVMRDIWSDGCSCNADSDVLAGTSGRLQTSFHDPIGDSATFVHRSVIPTEGGLVGTSRWATGRHRSWIFSLPRESAGGPSKMVHSAGSRASGGFAFGRVLCDLFDG